MKKHRKLYSLLIFLISLRLLSQVGINTVTPNPKAALHVMSKNNNTGILFPLLTTAQRDAIGAAATEDGLIIYNTDQKCYNYYNAGNTAWISLCGNGQKAAYTTDCNSVKVYGSYTQGTPLNNNNYVSVSVTVTIGGTYNILAKTPNGYYFEKSGVFPGAGTYVINLNGVGTPVTGPQTDTLSFSYEGITDTTCTSKTVNVLSSQVSYGINCSGSSVSGIYNSPVQLDYNTNTVSIPLSNVNTAGTVNITTSTNNGVSFATTENITAASTSFTLHGVGIPAGAGTYSYSFTTNGANPQVCTFNVTFGTTVGTFANPANRCLEIFSAGKTTDGYYWVKDASSNPYKTYCDMSNGGWTLIKSLSERQILVVEQTQNESWATQAARNAVTTETGIFNEYAFSLPAAAVSNIGNSTSTSKEYRFSIKEKGQTGTTVSDIESSTVAPINDNWVKNNYLNAIVTDGNLATGNYTTYGNTTKGKIFGFDFGKPVTGVTLYKLNGVDFQLNIPGLYSQASFFTGIFGGNGYASNNTPANNLTYTYPGGQTYTFNKYYVNDLFGLYMNNESQLNHHIGTCSNSTDDYGGASFCNNGWANWRPHNLNLKSGNYEGRIIQYWIK
ncbi:fibrinogen-like YCDxxxxGGGW domain-containing protein [Chryseobacterium viscerum]|uniref:Fibrinogen C-terminal domain-containing protein n=1 Tax=Chryseobacterium viscerum TaxID=1037377 RepID=A0A5N4BLY6_9FLAO|nr:fibrinogen-like YCDxxxxGGGW domain-containing protein [Chryseobacterium viscerum]KAB1229449.1 hypothetical protein F8D52_17955 [Chryseobacterium viscerum]